MPTLNDFYNKMSDIDNDLKSAGTDVNKMDADVNAGFAQTAIALGVLVQLGTYADDALSHISKQNDTIICILEHVSQNTCALLSEAHRQTALQDLISHNMARLTEMFESAHPEAAVDLSRREELRRRIEACCPPKEEPPACSYKACDAPRPLKEFEAPRKIG
jgi:hypothetical protein